MKKIIIFLFLAVQTFGLEPPKPIKRVEGMSSISGGIAGLTIAGLKIALPEGWGIGDSNAAAGPNTTKYFSFFSPNSKWGSQAEVTPFKQEADARAEVSRLRSTFSNVSDLPDGFEAKVKNARYACRQDGTYVIQIWYSLPKKHHDNVELWNKLKNSISVAKECPREESAEWVPISELPRKGWVCHHPNNKLHVLYKSFPFKAEPNKDTNKTYRLAFSDYRLTGFFYVKWDQENIKTKALYQSHLKEITEDILAIEPRQKFAGPIQYDLENGGAFQIGNPYSIITVSGDGFLFGFALKPLSQFGSIDMNDYIEKVAWEKDDE